VTPLELTQLICGSVGISLTSQVALVRDEDVAYQLGEPPRIPSSKLFPIDDPDFFEEAFVLQRGWVHFNLLLVTDDIALFSTVLGPVTHRHSKLPAINVSIEPIPGELR
jgi:hypothetical protein